MRPGRGQAGQTVLVTIAGRQFHPAVKASYDDPGRSEVATAFGATLGAHALEDVLFVDTESITASVPATLSPGVYDLTVRDPAGRQGTLASAFTVTAPADGGPDGSVTDGAVADILPTFPDGGIPDGFVCPSECENDCGGGVCRVNCAAGCTCPAGLPCLVLCAGGGECSGRIDCSQATACYIFCLWHACTAAIACGSGDCRVLCGPNSCQQAIDCRASCRCSVSCTASSACGGTLSCPPACASCGPGKCDNCP